jgi:bifunctional non-homologous end joining protein LigD
VTTRPWSDDPASVRPMLATTVEAPLQSAALVYEPKYDGIRALVAAGPSTPARFWSRLGNEKTAQFPEIAEAVDAWAKRLDRPVLIDGEIVALDESGEPCGFQNLQGRIHLKNPGAVAGKGAPGVANDGAVPRISERHRTAEGRRRPPAGVQTVNDSRVALVAFDILRDGDDDVRPLPLRERRRRLEALMRGGEDPRLRISEQVAADGREMRARAERLGWEGLIAKNTESAYRSGRRSPEWRKLKLVRHQTCVVAGWTEPRGSRPFFGALLLGVYDDDERLHYIGHTGAGFNDAELGRVWKKLQALKTKVSPFVTTPRTNERPHWVKPQLVAEVKFTEWTADGKLRHPTYLGLRDDVTARSVRKEPDAQLPLAGGGVKSTSKQRPSAPPHERVASRARARSAAPAKAAARPSGPRLTNAAVAAVIDRLDDIQDRGGDGVLALPGGERLEVSNLGKTFWPALKLTKGDLLRHYARVAAVILPVVADRPLVLKRYPNGVAAKPFYQHRAPDALPPGVRVQMVATDTEERPHFIGGDLKTLLYTAQLASISQDPWFSRMGALDVMDHVAIDLDPPDGMAFSRVLDVAKWVHEELEELGAPGFPKTSGSGGLHVYVPMPAGTTYDAGLLFCQIVATMVANKHPKAATVERSFAARGRRVYVDYLQNIRGKTLASAYSARANDFAGVSTPLTWEEVEEGVSPKDFTVRNFAERLAAAGDLWAGLRKSKGADLRAVEKYMRRR